MIAYRWQSLYRVSWTLTLVSFSSPFCLSAFFWAHIVATGPSVYFCVCTTIRVVDLSAVILVSSSALSSPSPLQPPKLCNSDIPILTTVTRTFNRNQTMSRRLSIVDLTSTYQNSDRRDSNSSSRDHRANGGGHQTTTTITPPPRGIKRRRHDDGFWSSEPSTGDEQDREPIESIDLTEPENPLSKTLAKQREDAIKAQQTTEEEKGRSILTSYKCPVCMDTPEDATSTTCGMFGHFAGKLRLAEFPFVIY